ncbi:MAG: hypothetical protein J6A59_13715 [Lachnospiraceae bacterium]|nr:hypothetical protein [Lachnospiraceae bacterium]
MRITQTNTPEDFQKLKKHELHKLWFHDALTDKQIAKKFGITKQDVKQKRKEFNLNMLNSAMLSVAGSPLYKKHK